MKKTLTLAMLLALFLFSNGIAYAIAQDQSQPLIAPRQGLERIPNPQAMKLYEKIEKIGNSFFGIKRKVQNQKRYQNQIQHQEQTQAQEQVQGQPVDMVSATTTLENPNLIAGPRPGQMERIPNLQAMKMFEKVKKIGKDLLGIRKGAPAPVMIGLEQSSCVTDAINKRTTALKSAMTDHAQEILALVDVKASCQIAALSKTTAQEQADANEQCLKDDLKLKAKHDIEFEKARLEIQKAFQSEVKACLGTQNTASSTTSSVVSE